MYLHQQKRPARLVREPIVYNRKLHDSADEQDGSSQSSTLSIQKPRSKKQRMLTATHDVTEDKPKLWIPYQSLRHPENERTTPDQSIKDNNYGTLGMVRSCLLLFRIF